MYWFLFETVFGAVSAKKHQVTTTVVNRKSYMYWFLFETVFFFFFERERERERETQRRKSLFDWPVAFTKVKLMVANCILAKTLSRTLPYSCTQPSNEEKVLLSESCRDCMDTFAHFMLPLKLVCIYSSTYCDNSGYTFVISYDFHAPLNTLLKYSLQPQFNLCEGHRPIK